MIKAGYKETELGEIPEEWEIVDLNNVADYYNGYPFEPTQWETYGTPIIRIQNLTGSSNVINYFNGLLESRYRISNGDLLLSWSATLNVYIWHGGDAYLNQHIFKVLPKKNIDKMYLYNVLGIVIRKLKNEVHGSTMKHFVKSALSLVNVPVPPSYEQQKIAKILLDTDALISSLDELITKKQNIKTGLMQELLTKGIGHTEFKDTEIGRIPKEWELKALKDIYRIKYGKSPKKSNYGTTPVIGSSGVYSHTNIFLAESGAIVIGRKGNAGKVYFINKECWPSDTTFYIEPINLLISTFTYYYLFNLNISGNDAKTTLPSLQKGTLESIPLIIPSLVEQKKIADILSDIQQEIEALEQKREKYKMIKSGLMQQLLTGKVRVK